MTAKQSEPVTTEEENVMGDDVAGHSLAAPRLLTGIEIELGPIVIVVDSPTPRPDRPPGPPPREPLPR